MSTAASRDQGRAAMTPPTTSAAAATASRPTRSEPGAGGSTRAASTSIPPESTYRMAERRPAKRADASWSITIGVSARRVAS